MRPDKARILDTCLTEVQAGRMTIEQALAAYPEHADELGRLLALAHEAHMELAPAGLDAARQRGLGTRIRAALGVAPQPAERLVRRKPALRFAPAVLVITLLVLLFGTGGVMVASAAALPGDALYGVKRAGEDLRLALSFSPARDVDLLLDFAALRMEEVQALVDAGRYEELPAALDGLDEAVAKVGEEAEHLGDAPLELQALDSQIEAQIQALEQVRDRVPLEAQSAIENALERSRHSQDVLDTLQHGGRPSDLAPGQLKKEDGQGNGPANPNGNGQPENPGQSKDKDKTKDKDEE